MGSNDNKPLAQIQVLVIIDKYGATVHKK